jgi:hypothetical protein
MLAARLGLGVIRCAHTITDQGTPPTAEQMTADTLSTTLDSAIILEVIRCCLPEIPGVKALKVDVGTPQGVLGGCAGWEWQVVVGIDLCACPAP